MPGPATQAPLEPPGGLDERFCEVMDAAPVMIWVSGQDKLCNWFNKPWLEFTGRSMAQELGNGWVEGVHPDDFTRCLDIYVGHFDARRPFRMQYRLRRHDGVYRWIDDIGIPRQARDGTFLGYVGSCIDIHEHREVQGVLDSAREMQRVVDQTPFLLIRCTRDLRFRFISNSFATMVGRRPEEILGKRIDEVIGPDVYAIIRPRIDQVLEGQRVEFESRTPAHAGERRALHVVYTPERDERGAVTGWIASIIDIDDRKRAEDALRRQRDRAALLSRTLEELLAAKDPDTIVRDLFPRVAGHVNADAFFNFMVDEPGRAMRLHASAGISDALAHSIRRLEFGQAICGRVALHRHPIHATDIQNSSEEASALVRGWGIQAYFCNPLLVGEDLLGTLSFASRSRPSFDDDEREFLTTVSQYTAIAMHRLRSEAALRESEERLRMLLAEVNHRSKNMPQKADRRISSRGSSSASAPCRRARIFWSAASGRASTSSSLCGPSSPTSTI
jgi:PAS domain S-box-containing protein